MAKKPAKKDNQIISGATTDVPAQNVPLDQVVCLEPLRRRIDLKKMKQLAKSIERDGLKTAIDVKSIRSGMHQGKYLLVTGAHRLAAYKFLGLASIPAKILSLKQARGLEEGENLFRADLRALDESLAIVKYARRHGLDKSDAATIGGQQPHDKGYSRIAKQLGFSRKRVADAYLHHSLPEEIRERIIAVGLDDNCKTLTEIAQMGSAKDQERFLEVREGNGASTIAKIGKEVSERPELMQEVEGLLQAWQASYFKKAYDLATSDAKLEFRRRIR